MSNEENIINFDEFIKVDLRVAKIIEAKDVEEADKLLEIRVDIGSEERTIFAGIKGYYDPSELVGKMIVVVANLKPEKCVSEFLKACYWHPVMTTQASF